MLGLLATHGAFSLSLEFGPIRSGLNPFCALTCWFVLPDNVLVVVGKCLHDAQHLIAIAAVAKGEVLC